MDLELLKTIVYLLTGGFLVFLAITVTRDNFINRLNRLAGALLFFSGLGPICMAIGSLVAQTASTSVIPFEETTTYQLHHLWEFFFPVLLVFSWSYPTDRLKGFRYPWLRYAVFVPQLVQVIVALFAADMISSLSDMEAAASKEGFLSMVLKPLAWAFSLLLFFADFVKAYQQTIFGWINLFYVGLSVWFLESGRRYITDPRLLTQTKVIFWGLRLGLVLYAATLLGMLFAPETFSPILLSVLMIAAPLAGATAFAFAIVRYQFLDVRLVFRQSLVYTFTSALLVGLYILLILQAGKVLNPVFGEQAEIMRYLFIVFLLLAFQPINNWVDNIVRSMFMRTRTDYRNIVERFSRQIISKFDPRQLIQIIDETMKTALLVERVYLVMYDDSIHDYAFIPSNDTPNRIVVARDDLMLRGINLLDAPTPFESLSDYEEDSALAAALKERNARLILPMKDADHLLGFVALTAKVAGYRYTAEDYNLLGVLSNQMVSALTNARLYVESLERIRLQEEVNMARQIQVNLLPANPPCLDCYSVAASSTPSRTVGGDFYDFINIDGDDRIGMVIADASGKGMPAALMIAQIQAIIRSELHSGNSISQMLTNMNQQMAESSSPETYVTLFYGELDAERRVFHYANAGHNYPILVRRNGSHEKLEVGGPIIGAFPSMSYESSSVKLEPDDVIFLFTDGLSEAMDAQEVEYGEPKILDMVIANRDRDPEQIMNNILEDVHRFDPTSPPQDDTTIITLKVRDRNGNKHG